MRYNYWLTNSDILGAFPFLFEVEENIQVEARLGVDGTMTEEPWEKRNFQNCCVISLSFKAKSF